MASRSSASTRKRQQGVALLIIIIVLAFASIAYMIMSASADEIKVSRQIKNTEVLNEARRMLITHAITNSYRISDVGRIGNLPCPDGNNAGTEGNQDPNCGDLNSNAVGYFPWKRIGGDVLKDSSGSCLLYAVSPSYKLNNARMLNADSNGLFQIVDMDGVVTEGNQPEDRPVAIIFAADVPVGVQARTFDKTSLCGKDFVYIGAKQFVNLDAYLDNNGLTDNAELPSDPNTIDQFVHANATSADDINPVNDKFVTIKKSDIWDVIRARTGLEEKLTEITEALAVCLRDYANANTYRQLPWPAALDLSASVDSYYVDNNYSDVNPDTPGYGYAGRFPYDIGNSNFNVDGSTWPDVFLAGPTCSNIDLPSSAVVESIDLGPTGEHGIIWHNWKDHFYYALSKKYAPDNAASNDSICNGSNGCVSVNTAANKYAAIVFYSGESINGVVRTSSEVAGDTDQKAVIANYLENNNQGDFPDLAGERMYESGLAGNNDVMFCITDESPGDDLNVQAC